ncbi:acyl-CoA dehydrogenase family protein [Thauera sinica]|uniref:Acyl-CoA dehydrogenase family protein n=1 Tax=Thauera sinica TaxID=2665146 RepID=A0ABW1AWZ1_9RHOO|nr:acyl-CoA dehydrogenase family protein [Thauera sp. K11]ATE61179.1 acyl-CoA dehydrogenase [Thauera sp. K11]
MDFSLNEDHLALADAVRRFCDGEYPLQHRGNPESTDEAARRLAGMAEMGLLGLPFPAAFGGGELGPVEIMLAAREFGRCLGGGPFLSGVVMAGQLLARLGSDAQKEAWLPALAQGSLQVALAAYEDGARYDWQRVATRAVPAAGGYVLHGRKSLVLNGDAAGLLLVVARTSGEAGERRGLTVFAVDAGTPGLAVRGFDTLDGRRAAHLALDGAAVGADRVLGCAGEAADDIEAVLDAGAAALCAEVVGAVEALMEHTVEHLRTRKQFGVPLARFQVLQHRVADMAIALEMLKSMDCAAAMALAGADAATRRRMVSAAKVLASQQGRQLGMAAIQMHGAMGMTDECRVGHYAKRLMVIGQLLGDAGHHLRRFDAQRQN